MSLLWIIISGQAAGAAGFIGYFVGTGHCPVRTGRGRKFEDVVRKAIIFEVAEQGCSGYCKGDQGTKIVHKDNSYIKEDTVYSTILKMIDIHLL